MANGRESAASDRSALLALRSAAAVRARCQQVFAHVAAGRSPHFTLEIDRLDAVAASVAEVTRAAYPDLVIPYHSRWPPFAAGGIDRWAALAPRLADLSPIEIARVAVDLATVSVLLDAGAGDAWSYREPGTGGRFARSEGLAVASFHMFAGGAFSSDRRRPPQADAAALQALDAAALARGLQAGADNPLPGLERRAELLRRLGHALAARPDLFGAAPARPGHLIDGFLRASPRRAAAADVLAAVLDGLSPIWPSGLSVDGVLLGDAGRHPAVRTDDRSSGIVPFHKLSQWLTYSLLEPFETAGIAVVDLDGLTGLPEYRNGGLLLDLGVIRPRAPLAARYDVASEFIVEWRALTVALLDRLLAPVRSRLGLDASRLSLAQMLQGGTWAAGRQVAARLRPPAGPPPIQVQEDGTVF